ncbi:Sensor protein CpxA [Marinomonas gallaica]|uniref:histidine kinase n=1 Tax=Marinomonas gallaica TaxID=1806667 RepID=A0A1C3JUT6_9GAMM|nr:HAMP domain-containing sensor histidine kinase [Marinomonas gallaica]SBT19011.1 Sensor protein CpxA [Marinomonas gallaica]SBT21966.1 Sensor protein CpxA [Marinomonas gallaica]
MDKIDISTILASAIHESKNHLGTILYQLESLKRLNLDQEGQKSLRKVEEGMKQLNDEWVEYLYLYRLASDGYEVLYDCHALEEFLDDQVFALTPSATAKNLLLEFNADQSLTAVFDERLMTSVVSTGVYNALRFAKTTIQISAYLENDYLVIAIEDDGKGFAQTAKEEDELLFQTNTGLGLYFADLSAQAHSVEDRKGFISKASSEALGGAKLAIYLPQ